MYIIIIPASNYALEVHLSSICLKVHTVQCEIWGMYYAVSALWGLRGWGSSLNLVHWTSCWWCKASSLYSPHPFFEGSTHRNALCIQMLKTCTQCLPFLSSFPHWQQSVYVTFRVTCNVQFEVCTVLADVWVGDVGFKWTLNSLQSLVGFKFK